MLKLPKDIETPSAQTQIEAALMHDLRPLWIGGSTLASHLAFTPGWANALRREQHFGHLIQGIETIEPHLQREAKGLEGTRSGAAKPSERLSRLLLVANDGSERFYRSVETLLRHHADRLYCCVLEVDGKTLGEAVFDAPKLVRALLVGDRKAVARILLSLTDATANGFDL